MTTMMDTSRAPTVARAETVFRRVLVGVDGSPASHEAARQAAAPPRSRRRADLLSAFGVTPTVAGPAAFGIPAYIELEAQQDVAKSALEAVQAELEGDVVPRTLLARDTSWEALIREARREGATLITVGSHGTGRARGIALGSTTTEVVHKAPCSVLVTRPSGPTFRAGSSSASTGRRSPPRHTRSPGSSARASGPTLWPVVARGGKDVDERLVATIVGHHYEGSPDKPVPALVAAASDADLLVVGSRGLHGLGSLGSVSERVAHQAASSVLIVRDGDSD